VITDRGGSRTSGDRLAELALAERTDIRHVDRSAPQTSSPSEPTGRTPQLLDGLRLRVPRHHGGQADKVSNLMGGTSRHLTHVPAAAGVAPREERRDGERGWSAIEAARLRG
jgi:hypothetical protein